MLIWKVGHPPGFVFVRAKTKTWPPMPVEVFVYKNIIIFRLDLINLGCFRAPYKFSVILSNFGWFYEPTKVTDLTTLLPQVGLNFLSQ